MEVIMQPGASFTGILDRSTGYYIRQRGNRFFAVRMRNFFSLLARCQVSRDGHWMTITQFAQLALIGNIVKDIRVSGLELHRAILESRWDISYCAILESRYTIPHTALEYKHIYTAAEVYELKSKYNL